MRHVHRSDKGARAKTPLLQLLGLLQWDHLVAHAMDYQASAGDLVHFLQVVELLS